MENYDVFIVLKANIIPPPATFLLFYHLYIYKYFLFNNVFYYPSKKQTVKSVIMFLMGTVCLAVQ